MTRPFHFPLQRILDYRGQLEDQARMALGKAQQAYSRQVDLVQEIRASIERHEAALYEQEPNPQEMWLWRNYKARLVQELKDAERRMLELAQEVNRCRREAVNRSKDRKLLEKLKTKQKIRHDEEEELREQKEFDEAATLRYRHQDI
ncbi:flagellar export protein FliJ [Oceanidesulfovibrio indonesiensis]|jgi:flagellar FliJ protein|uniref:Flagellar FliJ protein n=1 Tax=Oceanidesulfovibrio indonesiensis TaxID=54767 RepID=A0A7M3ME93_9BACT|nr:flagellar export protein FliJ [Oceanidesulfovibrio indonesiensis]TVM16674.1 flagellar export protein FliJ [Oceanidesulfovibrio indonesiensis]